MFTGPSVAACKNFIVSLSADMAVKHAWLLTVGETTASGTGAGERPAGTRARDVTAGEGSRTLQDLGRTRRLFPFTASQVEVNWNKVVQILLV